MYGLVPPRDSYSEVKPKARAVIVGESIASGAILTTGSGASADLLLTNGTLAHLGENTKLVLSALYQKSFKGSDQKASELTQEVSPSRTALKLEEGDLVLEVRKLSKESSFLISTKMAQAGIRGTQFKVLASADSSELLVLEGRVDFLDSEQLATSVQTAKKARTRKGVPAKLEGMGASEQEEVRQAVEQAKAASASIDLNRLADTVDGYAPKPNYIVKSALDMELIWCSPGGYVRGDNESDQVILTKGFYLGKYEVTQEEYVKVLGVNRSGFEGDNLPVERVSWLDAMEFCKKLNEIERLPRGWIFVLPTGEEWEYACRSGTTTSFFWGDGIDSTRANLMRSNLGRTTSVGTYKANLWGFHDMHGNVWEWILKPDIGEKRVKRGGSFIQGVGRASDSFPHKPGWRNIHNGFRIALKQVD